MTSTNFTNSQRKASTKSKDPKYSYDKYKSTKPKRNKSAFIIWSLQARAQLKDSGKNANEIMVRLAELWKNLSQTEKKPYNQAALEDKNRYQRELDAFLKENPGEAVENKTKSNHVKKPPSAYGLFLRDMKDQIRQEQPELKMAAVLKVIAERWKALDEVSRSAYTAKAKKEKEASRQELAKYCIKKEGESHTSLKKTQQRQRNLRRKQVKLDNEASVVSEERACIVYEDNLLYGDEYSDEVLPSRKYEETETHTIEEDISSFDEFRNIEYLPLPQEVKVAGGFSYPLGRTGASYAHTEADDSHLLFDLSEQRASFNGYGVNQFSFGMEQEGGSSGLFGADLFLSDFEMGDGFNNI